MDGSFIYVNIHSMYLQLYGVRVPRFELYSYVKIVFLIFWMMEQVYGQDSYLGNVKNTEDTLSISVNIILMKNGYL
ncbi:hypothetical protein MtrunA17_Chr6g0464391 [Medicago truncatula]|uniref:Uncharacterized protein n=1 Tax=Medicago truncatula TaxID=3880 RepID=A0A396HCW1_MEDTR|nr:hypothetical protein MtrunA17_Chr6g0464391 [Medicago truncatula]